MTSGTDPERLEIDRTVDPDEYEAVQFGDWRKWHAVDGETDRTMCGLDRVNQRAQRMFHRWALEADQCSRCVRAVAGGGGNTPQRTIRVPDSEWDAAKQAADAKGETLSDAIRAALRHYVARNT